MARKCRHVREGRVTNQPDEYDDKRPHASIACCSRPTCVSNAIAWVAGQTNEPAHWVPDPPKGSRVFGLVDPL